MKISFFAAAVVLLCSLVVWAQDTSTNNPNSAPPPSRAGGNPCLRAAGISPSEFDQLRSIAQDARTQVREVCSNTSLSPQQARQQIQAIHQQSHAKMVGIVSANQRQAFMSCRARRGDRRPVEWFEHPGGNCGGAQRTNQRSAGATTAPEPDDTNGPSGNSPVRNSAPQNQSATQKTDSSPQ